MGKGEIIPRLAPPNPHIILREWDGQGHRLGPTIRLLLAPGAQAGPIAFPPGAGGAGGGAGDFAGLEPAGYWGRGGGRGRRPASVTEGVEVRVAVLEEQVAGLRGWQKAQNGSLQRLESRMDRLNWWIVGIAGGVATACVMLLIQTLTR